MLPGGKKYIAEGLTNSNNNKLAQLRNKLAQKVDSALGTNIEKIKLAKPLKKLEKVLSDKLLGKSKG